MELHTTLICNSVHCLCPRLFFNLREGAVHLDLANDSIVPNIVKLWMLIGNAMVDINSFIPWNGLIDNFFSLLSEVSLVPRLSFHQPGKEATLRSRDWPLACSPILIDLETSIETQCLIVVKQSPIYLKGIQEGQRSL